MISEGYEIGYIIENGERIGLYSFRIEGDSRFHISKLYLEQRFRGRGLGRKALEMMFDIARENGCTQAYLEVYHNNKIAFDMYLKAGMTDYHRYRESAGNGYYRDGYTMIKHL
jgi:ribosomal protein S18 acetylase RimI-like enzyme